MRFPITSPKHPHRRHCNCNDVRAEFLLAQLSTEYVTVDGQSRSYLKYLPVNLDPSEQLPLMMCFHGGSGSAEEQLAIEICVRLQMRIGFCWCTPSPARPQRRGTNWQVVTAGDLPFTFPNPHSDINFVSALIDAMLDMHNVLQGMPWGIPTVEDSRTTSRVA